MANNTWKNYTQKSTALSDNDEVMLLDSTDEKNKRGLMSKFWDYVVDKMSTAVISKLETNNKTIIGAINALNSDSFLRRETGNTAQTILPVNGGGATVVIAYSLGRYGNDGTTTVMAILRYNYEGTECNTDYIYSRGNAIIGSSISNNGNTITFKTQEGVPIKYIKVKAFNI